MSSCNLNLITNVAIRWPARSVNWHPQGHMLAIGFHEASKAGAQGQTKAKGKAKGDASAGPQRAAVALYSVKVGSGGVRASSAGFGGDLVTLSKVAEGCSSAAWIQEVKFTPGQGEYLMACSHDKKMYKYKITPAALDPSVDLTAVIDLEKCLTAPGGREDAFNKHSSAILHVDFTTDGKYFQTNCQAGELLFGEVETLKQETSATKMADYNDNVHLEEDDSTKKDVRWATQVFKLT